MNAMEPSVNQESPYAQAHEVGKKNVSETMDKVLDALAPLGNIGGYTEIFKQEAKKNYIEVKDDLENSVQESGKVLRDAADKSIKYTKDSAVWLGKRALALGLTPIGWGEAAVALVVHGIPAEVSDLDSKIRGWSAEQHRKAMEANKSKKESSRAAAEKGRLNRANMRGTRNLIASLRA